MDDKRELNLTIITNGLRWQHVMGVLFYSLVLYRDMSLEQTLVAALIGSLFLYLGDRQ